MQYADFDLSCAVYEGVIALLGLLARLFLVKVKMPLAFLITWAHCWLILN